MEYADTDPDDIANAIVEEIGRTTNYLPLGSTGAARAVAVLAQLLGPGAKPPVMILVECWSATGMPLNLSLAPHGTKCGTGSLLRRVEPHLHGA